MDQADEAISLAARGRMLPSQGRSGSPAETARPGIASAAKRVTLVSPRDLKVSMCDSRK